MGYAGVYETNNIADFGRVEVDYNHYPVTLGDPELKKIVRLRLLSDPGFPYWDVSYCYGELKNGTIVRVELPHHISLRKRSLKGDLIEMAKFEKAYAKGLGLLDDAVISKLC